MCIPGIVMTEHKQVTSAGFQHLIFLVHITMRQDHVTPMQFEGLWFSSIMDYPL